MVASDASMISSMFTPITCCSTVSGFWPLFTATAMTAAGVLLTSGHLGFAAAQLLAASGPRARAAV